jgi:hypothetical protein
VQRVGQDRQAVCPKPTDDLQKGKKQVQEKCRPDVARAVMGMGVGMRMIVIHRSRDNLQD